MDCHLLVFWKLRSRNGVLGGFIGTGDVVKKDFKQQSVDLNPGVPSPARSKASSSIL